MAFVAPEDDLAVGPRTTAFGDTVLGASPLAAKQAKDLGDAIIAGVQNSATGLAVRGKMPSQQLGEDAPWYHRLAAGAAGMAVDLPLSIVGAAGGMAAGAPAGPAGMAVGGGAGAFAAPMALREALVEAYNHNAALSWAGAWDIAAAGLKGGVKGAVIGAATAGAGRVVVPLVTKAGGGATAATVAATGAELATLTTTAAALEGHLPTWQDFMDNAILLGGMKAAVHVAKGMRNIYAETGRTPEQVLADIAKKPELVMEMKPVEGASGAKDAVTVYHASPHEFDKFDTSKIGTGQGAASFGKGLYLAENPDVARDYFMQFNEKRANIDTLKGDTGPQGLALRVLEGSDGNLTRAIEALESRRKNAPADVEWQQKITDAIGFLREGPPGSSFYKVEVSKATVDKMLDWDLPIEQQPPALRAVLEQLSKETNIARGIGKNSAGDVMRAALNLGLEPEAALAKAGATGIKYLDAGSRDAGAGTRNFVVFNHNDIRIVERNGQKLPGDLPPSYAPQALEQRIQAALDVDPRPEMIRKNLSNDGNPPKLGESPIADPVKYEYITDRDTAKGVLRAVTGMYETEISAQTRGVVTNKATAVEAAKMISDGVISERVVGEAGNAAEIYARAHMLKGAANHAVTELQKLAGTPEAELTPAAKLQALAALERVAMLKAELEGVGAEAGRALQIFRTIKRDPAYLGEAETLIKLAERKGALQDIAALALRMRDPAQLAEFARKYVDATTTEKVIEAWKAGILSGPQTHLANILGNTMKWGVEVPESVIAATITAAQRAIKGDPLTMAQYKARALAPLYGLQHGSREALFVASEVWKGQGERLEKADVYRVAIEGKTGEVIRLPFKALQIEDALFRTVAERAKSYEIAVDRVVKEGLHPETKEARERIVQYTQRPEFGLPEKQGLEAIAKVQEAGAEAVFAQRLGPRMETLQRAMAGHWSQLIIPFVRTPANLVSWAVQHVPGLNLVSGRWREDFAAGGERQARAVARVLVGAGLTVTAYQLAQDGLLTGAGMFDKEQGATKRAAGWQAYSVKIGDTYYSYQRIEPVAKVLGIAADLVELSARAEKEEDKAKIAALMVLMFGNATVSTTYLSGLSNAIQSVTDPARYGENFLEQYASSVVPKIVGQTTAMADPYKREVEGVIDAVQSQIPFLREKLLPKRDVWGEPQKSERWFAVMPIATSKASEDKVRMEAMRLQIAIADAPRFILEKGPFNPKDKRVKLEPEQRDIFKDVSGHAAMNILAPIVNAPDWASIPDFAKAAIYKDVIEGARKQGQYAALPPDDAARVKLREKIIDKVLKQTLEAQGK